MKNFSKILILSLLFIPIICLAQEDSSQENSSAINQIDQSEAFAKTAGIKTNTTVAGIASTLISVVLGFLGIVFISLLVYGGFSWMTAQGNEEEAKKAMGIIKTAVIGLIIIISAYSITHFVFSALNETTSQTGSLSP